jgi:uncharacterized membrane protein YcgQ (UPF0703/DUF1980 family)
MRLIPLVLFCVALILVQCKSNLAQSRKTYDSLIVAKVGEPFEVKMNSAKTYSLAHATDAGQAELKYVVIKLENNQVALEGKYNKGGYVRWMNDTMIEVLTIPKHITTVTDTSLYKQQIFLEQVR